MSNSSADGSSGSVAGGQESSFDNSSRSMSDPNAGMIMVKSVTGEEVALPDIWKHRKVAMVFLRHLGCRFCLQQTAHLVENKVASKLKEADPDSALVVISMGTVAQAVQWVEITKFDGEVYVDDTTDGNVATAANQDGSHAYKVMKLQRGVSMVMNDRTQAVGESVNQQYPDLDGEGWTEKDDDGNVVVYPGDIFQVGGAFVFGPGNQCDFAFRSEYAGHYPELSALLYAATGRRDDGGDFVYESTKTWFNRLNADTPAEPSTRPRSASSMPDVVTKKFAESGSANTSGETTAVPWYKGVSESGIPLIFSGKAKGLGSVEHVITATVGVGTVVYMSVTYDNRSVSFITLFIAMTCALMAIVVMRVTEVALQTSKSRLQRAFGGRGGGGGGASSSITLLKRTDIDRLQIEAGMLDCDCGLVLSNLPMFGMREPTDPLPNDGNDIPTPRKRGETWTPLPSDTQSPAAKNVANNEIQAMMCYLREFLAKPHPAVGRPGPVCPFVPTSLKKDLIYMSVINTSGLSEASPGTEQHELFLNETRKHMAELLSDFAPRFEKLEPSEGRLRQYKTAIFIFPDIDIEDAHDTVDYVQAQVKRMFVERGLMIGEFHSANNATGLRNDKFYPLRTPFPCLAVRHMVPGDFVFMTLDAYEHDLQVKLLEGFLNVFGGDSHRKEVKEAKEKLAKLKR